MIQWIGNCRKKSIYSKGREDLIFTQNELSESIYLMFESIQTIKDKETYDKEWNVSSDN